MGRDVALEFRKQVLGKLIEGLRLTEQVVAVWEGGSAANASTDEYSDIDLNILVAGDDAPVFRSIEELLNSTSKVTHVWNEPKSIWPDLTQKIYFLKDSPKHFFVDVAVFPQSSSQILSEFMQTERHGHPVVHIDKAGLIVSRPADKTAILQKQRKRLGEIAEAFPVYRTEVLKELDRGHFIDAFAFYQSAMLRPLVEALGMLHRPFQFDFGLRYLHRSFPKEVAQFIEAHLFVKDGNDLRKNALEVDELFYKTVDQIKSQVFKDLK